MLRRGGLLLAILLFISACSPGSSDSAGASGDTEAPAEASGETAETTDGTGDTTEPADTSAAGSDEPIAAVIKGLDNPFFGAMRDGIQAEADDDDDVGVEVQAAQSLDDTTGQADRLSTLAGQDFACYIVNPISETNLVQPLADVAEQDVPIVNIDLPIATEAAEQVGAEIDTYIGTDNVQAGRIGGEFMNEHLGGSGMVALIGGIEGDPTSRARLDGFTGGAGDLEIVTTVAGDWDRQTALTQAETILNDTPDLDGFFAANDIMALGISQAVANAGRTGEVAVVGVDGIQDALAAVEQGALTATVSQYPFVIGLLGVDACQAAVDGQELPDNVDAPVQLITEDNAVEAQEQFPLPPAPFDNPFADE